MSTTAEQQTETLHRAARAITAYYAADDPATATREVELALRACQVDGVSPAQVAGMAGVRQLLVARLVPGRRARAAALTTARHDAQRHLDEVVDAVRAEAVGRWHEAGGVDAPRGTKMAIADELDVSRTSFYDWLGQDAPAGPDLDGPAEAVSTTEMQQH